MAQRERRRSDASPYKDPELVDAWDELREQLYSGSQKTDTQRRELQEAYLKYTSSTPKSLDLFESLDLLDQEVDALLHEVEKRAVGSGSRRSAPTETCVARDKEACPFCGKLLTVNYLKKHQKKWCKKAAAAAAPAVDEEEEAPEVPWVISNVRSLASEGAEQC